VLRGELVGARRAFLKGLVHNKGVEWLIRVRSAQTLVPDRESAGRSRRLWSSSQWTLSWREQDSNPRSLVRGGIMFRPSVCRIVIGKDRTFCRFPRKNPYGARRNGLSSTAGPRVRISIPPAVSQQRTEGAAPGRS
jgi:hypothetical protein